ncbi:MAG: hypothetical protein Q8R84_06740 [Candidatus Nitrotoga sp.]|nr:hypothetical protein [Candidatus Nitrotoga sp.]
MTLMSGDRTPSLIGAKIFASALHPTTRNAQCAMRKIIGRFVIGSRKLHDARHRRTERKYPDIATKFLHKRVTPTARPCIATGQWFYIN